MRIYFPVFISAILICSCQSHAYKGPNGVVYTSARQYNDYIISRQVKLFEHIAVLGKTLESGWEPSTRQLQAASQENKQVIIDIQGMPAFGEDSAFRDAAVRLFRYYQELLDRDYPQLFATMQEPGITREEIDKATNALTERVTAEEKKLNSDLQTAQRNFAKRNKLELVDNPNQEKLEKTFGAP